MKKFNILTSIFAALVLIAFAACDTGTNGSNDGGTGGGSGTGGTGSASTGVVKDDITTNGTLQTLSEGYYYVKAWRREGYGSDSSGNPVDYGAVNYGDGGVYGYMMYRPSTAKHFTVESSLANSYEEPSLTKLNTGDSRFVFYVEPIASDGSTFYLRTAKTSYTDTAGNVTNYYSADSSLSGGGTGYFENGYAYVPKNTKSDTNYQYNFQSSNEGKALMALYEYNGHDYVVLVDWENSLDNDRNFYWVINGPDTSNNNRYNMNWYPSSNPAGAQTISLVEFVPLNSEEEALVKNN